MDFFTQECVLVSSESNRRSFGTPNFFCGNFCQKVDISRGGGGQRQFGKSLHFDFFLHPSLIPSSTRDPVNIWSYFATADRNLQGPPSKYDEQTLSNPGLRVPMEH